MLPPPPKVMPGELAGKCTYAEHGYYRNQLEHHDTYDRDYQSPAGK
jgi:hypothetical protein